MRLVITGATGYVGRHLVNTALARGFLVTALARHPHADSRLSEDVRWVNYELGQLLADSTYEDVSAIIHLANAEGPEAERQNVDGTEALLIQTRRLAITRFVFVSSQSAQPNAPSAYGRSKWRIEQMLQAPCEISIRPGLVYGGAEAGLYGTMCRLVQISPILPHITGPDAVQPVHITELCTALLHVATGKFTECGPICIGAAQPIAFGEFLRLLAWERFGRRLHFIPVPGSTVVALTEIGRRTRLIPEALLERVQGLLALRPMATAPALGLLGLALTPLASGLAAEAKARRRRLIREGWILQQYAVGVPPSIGSVLRYVRVVERYGNSRPLPLPSVCFCWPPLLRLVEPVGFGLPVSAPFAALRRRLDLSVALGEATPRGAARLREFAVRSPLSAMTSATAAIAVEALLVPARILVTLLSALWSARIWREALKDA